MSLTFLEHTFHPKLSFAPGCNETWEPCEHKFIYRFNPQTDRWACRDCNQTLFVPFVAADVKILRQESGLEEEGSGA